MKRKLLHCFLWLGILIVGAGCQSEGERIELADPTVIVANDKYYMTGSNGDEGIILLESKNLRHWIYASADPYILRKGEDTYGKHSFRTPQIVPVGDGYLLVYSAQGKLCVAESKEITGPYKQRENRPVSDSPEEFTNNYLFKDDDGKWYMYHTRDVAQEDMKGNVIYVAEFDIKNQRMKEETLVECLRVTEPWELTFDGMQYDRKTVEDPTVFKRDSTYYLFYSANDYRSMDCAVGYAIAKSPFGPWEKHPGPMVHVSEVEENGAGHGDFFFGLDKAPYYIYNVHKNDSTVDPRSVRIIPLKMPKHRVTGTFHITTKKKDNVIVPKLFR